MITSRIQSAAVHNRILAILLALGLVLATGCGTVSKTEEGAAAGAGVGAAVGGAIGEAVGSTAKGAIVGAVVGGTAGAIIGRQMDRQAEELEEDLEDADVQRVEEGIVVTFDSGILFDFDSAELRPDAKDKLADLAGSAQDFENTEILVVGHTDSVGADSYNQQLSDQRAEAAGTFLMEQGVRPSRVTMTGQGEAEPIATNETETGRQENRRVEVAIYASEELREEVQESSSR